MEQKRRTRACLYDADGLISDLIYRQILSLTEAAFRSLQDYNDIYFKFVLYLVLVWHVHCSANEDWNVHLIKSSSKMQTIFIFANLANRY
jgi:uncharacterized membrane protein